MSPPSSRTNSTELPGLISCATSRTKSSLIPTVAASDAQPAQQRADRLATKRRRAERQTGEEACKGATVDLGHDHERLTIQRE